jgi:2-polyprenyl-6-methoxyphenol hydroxylase-like FAD-dependent oxidoreductase
MNIPTAEIAHKHDLPPPLIVERGEVLRALYEALGEGVVAWGHEVTGYSQNGELDLEFAGAPAQSGGVAILADGLDSRLRQSAFGRTPRYAGYQSYRGIADFEHHAFPHGQWTAVFGRGTRIGVTHLGRGKIFWFAGVMGDEENAFAGDPPKEVAAAHLKKFYAPIPELVEATPESQIWHTAIRDIEPLERWTDGRVTLLGDAAHATTPNLGRGSGEALEDAVAIGKTLAGIDLDDRGAVVAALARFEARRRPLTTEVQKESWKAGEIASWTNPMKCLVRNQVMRRIVGPKAAKQVDDELEELIERGVG